MVLWGRAFDYHALCWPKLHPWNPHEGGRKEATTWSHSLIPQCVLEYTHTQGGVDFKMNRTQNFPTHWPWVPLHCTLQGPGPGLQGRLPCWAIASSTWEDRNGWIWKGHLSTTRGNLGSRSRAPSSLLAFLPTTCLHSLEPRAPALHGQLPAAPVRPGSRGGPLLPTLYILQKC